MKTTKKLWSMVLCVCLLLTMLCTVPAAAATEFGEDMIASGQGIFDGLTRNEKESSNGTLVYYGHWQATGKVSTVQYDEEDASETPDSYLKLVATSATTATAAYSSSFLEDKIAPKKTYLVSFKYASATTGQAYIQIYEYPAYVGEDGKNKNDGHKIELPSTGGEWKESAFLFTTDASGAGVVNSISLSLNSHNYYIKEQYGYTDTVLFDNVALCEVNTEGADLLTHLAAGTATAEGYAADESGNVLLQLFPSGWTTGDKAVVSGYVKASAGEAVTVSAGTAFTQDGAGKTFTGTGEWIPFSIPGVAYNCNITVAAIGAGAEIKGITIQKDTNILADTVFGGKWAKSYGGTYTISSDTDSPVAGACLKMERTQNEKKYLYYTNFVTWNAKERYLFSVWYKSEITASVSIEHKGYETDSPSVDLPPTNGKWKRMEFVFEMLESEPTNKTIYLQLGYQKNGKTETGSVFFCAPSIETLSNVKRNSLYAPCGTLMTVTGKDMTGALPHMQILGEPVQSAAGLDEVKAVYINGETPSTGSIVMATYTKDANNTKQLLNVSVSEALPSTGVAYPTATISTSELTTGDEIRAFLWDGISGLKPLDKAITTTK